MISERYRLESFFLDALARLMAAQEALGDHSAALAAARQLLDKDPLREDAHRMAMRAQCHLGQRHAALSQYRTCKQLLRQELDAEPMAETQALYRAILEGRFACAAGLGGTAAVVPASHKPAQGRSPLDAAARIPLVGREQELACLAEAWQAALAGQCSLLLISGEAGVGKTRLAQEFADQQRWHGMRVVQGRCYEFERLLPYQPVAEALRSLPPALAAAASAAVPGWIIAQVTRLAPDLFGQAPELPGTASGQGAEEQERLFEAVSHFFAQLGRPAAAAADPGGPALGQRFDAAAAALPGTPPGGAAAAAGGHGAARGGLAGPGPGHAGPAAGAGWTGPAAAPVPPLRGRGGVADRPAVGRWRGRQTAGRSSVPGNGGQPLLPDPDPQGAVRGRGHPGRSRRVAGRLRSPRPGPAAAAGQRERDDRARVGRLSEQTQDAIQVAAVVGREFDFDLLHAAWGQGEEATLAALDDLLRQRLIGDAPRRSAGHDYAFTHHKIQEVIYSGLSRRRRQHLHGQVGTALERAHAGDLDTFSAQIAGHYEQAGAAAQAVDFYRRAAETARRVYANQDAIAYLSRALALISEADHAGRFRLVLARAQLYDVMGQREAQAQDLAMLGELAEALDEDGLRAEVALWRARYATAVSDYATALTHAQTAVTIAHSIQDQVKEAMGYLCAGGALWQRGEFEAAQGQLAGGAEVGASGAKARHRG